MNHRAGTDCFDNEKLEYRDGLWEVYRCSICGREATYIAKSPYDKSGKSMIENTSSQQGTAVGS